MPHKSSRWPQPMVFLLFAILSLAMVATAQAEITKKVTVTGVSAVYDGDMAAAFDSARKSALRRAVEEALGILISARTRVVNFAVIDDDILSATRGYVQSFTVVEQGFVKEVGLYEVTIEASVNVGDLQADLDSMELLLEESGRPRVSCTGGEYVLSDAGSSRVQWGTVCGELLAGLASFNTDLFQIEGLSESPSGEAMIPGLAEIQIVATASVQANQGLSLPFSDHSLSDFGIQSVVAEISARVQWSDTGETLVSTRATGRGADTSFRTAATSAISDAAPSVAAELGSALAEDLRSKLYDGRLIKLDIVSQNAHQQHLFEVEMNERFGAVERLYPRAQKPGEARSKGTAFDLARQLTAKDMPQLQVDIVSVTLNSMTLQLSEMSPTDTDHTR